MKQSLSSLVKSTSHLPLKEQLKEIEKSLGENLIYFSPAELKKIQGEFYLPKSQYEKLRYSLYMKYIKGKE